jgi:hypothetical protein
VRYLVTVPRAIVLDLRQEPLCTLLIVMLTIRLRLTALAQWDERLTREVTQEKQEKNSLHQTASSTVRALVVDVISTASSTVRALVVDVTCCACMLSTRCSLKPA